MTLTETRDVRAEVERYITLPYGIELIPDAEAGGYFVRVPDLLGCISQGETVEEAHAILRDVMRGWLTVGLEHCNPIPTPRPLTTENYSGQFRVRLPRRVYRALAEAAEQEGVSL